MRDSLLVSSSECEHPSNWRKAVGFNPESRNAHFVVIVCTRCGENQIVRSS